VGNDPENILEIWLLLFYGFGLGVGLNDCVVRFYESVADDAENYFDFISMFLLRR
jgi:hypothetical protein